jgi:predicted PurR-regulated permease PerM
MASDREFTRRLIQTVATVAGTAILLAVLWAARDALLLIYISAVVAMGFSPLVKLIERPHSRAAKRGVPRWLAILVIYASIIAVLGLVGLLVIPPLVAQAEALWTKLPTEINRLQAFLIAHRMMTRPVTLEEAVQNAPSGTSGNAVGTVLIAISSLIGGIFGIITVLILTFYLLVEAGSMFQYVTRFLPPARRDVVATVTRQAVDKVSAWLRAQCILAGVMGTFSAIGLGLMGVPYFYVIALIAAIGETIPIIGPVIGGIAAVAVAITVSPKLAVMVGAYFLALHQLEANILVPKIMERSVGVSPVAVMAALLVGGALAGIVGAVLAIPTAALLSVILEEIATDQSARLQRIK